MNVFSVFIVRSGFPAVTTFRRYEYQFTGKMDACRGPIMTNHSSIFDESLSSYSITLFDLRPENGKLVHQDRDLFS